RPRVQYQTFLVRSEASRAARNRSRDFASHWRHSFGSTPAGAVLIRDSISGVIPDTQTDQSALRSRVGPARCSFRHFHQFFPYIHP
ncbi:MAG TPA: hypothetical protein DDY41_00210, partial [Arthrobacter bacterium]|nr:hypothetical protein [Arthrobacter sp.]